MPRVIGGRYGLSSKEFTPGMVAGVLEELAREKPTRRFTIGINDDVSHTSLPYDPSLDIEPTRRFARCSSGWVRTERSARTRTRSRSLATRRTCTPRATSSTTPRSPARRPSRTCASGRDPIRAPYLVSSGELRRLPPVRDARARRGARSRGARARRCCSTALTSRIRSGTRCPRPVQEKLLAKRIELYAIDAGRIARDAGLAGRTNTVLQTCFFAISGVLERERGDRGDQGVDSARRTGSGAGGRGQAQRRGGRPLARRAAPGRGPRSGHRPRAGAARSCPRTRRVRPDGDRGDDGRPRR